LPGLVPTWACRPCTRVCLVGCRWYPTTWDPRLVRFVGILLLWAIQLVTVGLVLLVVVTGCRRRQMPRYKAKAAAVMLSCIAAFAATEFYLGRCASVRMFRACRSCRCGPW
jgi:hypothetical protein